MAQTLYLRSTQSSVVTTTTCKQLSTTQGSAANTGTSIKRARNTGTWQFIPGTANNTTTITTGTTPNTKGWLFDGAVPGQYASGNWTLTVENVDTSASGAANIKASLWVVTANGTAVTAVQQLANAAASSSFTPSTSKTAHTITFSGVPSVTLTSGQYLYLEVYLNDTSASSSSTATDTIELDDTGTASSLSTTAFTASSNGTLGATLDDAGISASASAVASASANVTLDAATVSANVGVDPNASVVATLGNVTASSSGTVSGQTAPSIVQCNDGSSFAQATVTVSFPTSPAAGNLLLVQFWNNGDNNGNAITYTPPSGWSQVDADTSQYFLGFQSFQHVVTAQDTNSYTFARSQPQRADSWIACEISGASSVLDGVGKTFVSNSSAFDTPALTPSGSSDLALAFMLPTVNSATWSNPSGWTVGDGPVSQWSGEAIWAHPSQSATSANATLSATSTGWAALVLVAPASANKTASLSAMLGGVTVSSSANNAVHASASNTLVNVTIASSATVKTHGTLSGTLGLTATAHGSLTNHGHAAVTLGGLTSSASAAVRSHATMAKTLGLSIVSGGSVKVRATAGDTLANLSIVSTGGGTGSHASVSTTLATLTAAILGEVVGSGSVVAGFEAVAVSASAIIAAGTDNASASLGLSPVANQSHAMGAYYDKSPLLSVTVYSLGSEKNYKPVVAEPIKTKTTFSG